MKPIKPTQSHVLWGGAVEIHCYGNSRNWSMAGTTAREADRNNPGIIDDLRAILEVHDCVVSAPNPSMFNARILKGRLPEAWIPGRLYRGREAFADGMQLPQPGCAFAVSSGDCPTLVMLNRKTGMVVAAHAGRDSLWENEGNGGYLVTGQVISAVGPLDGLQLHGFVACGIAPQHFRHPVDGTAVGRRNAAIIQRMTKFAKWHDRIPQAVKAGYAIDLYEAIREQLSHMGVPPSRIGHDGADTYADRFGGQPLWHSHRRGDKSRNLVLVIRRC